MPTGTTTQTLEHGGDPGKLVVKLQWLSSSVSGTFTTVALDSRINKLIRGKYCLFAITDPGDTTAPTDNYDIAFNDALGVDIFGAELNNRASGSGEQATPKIGNAYMGRLITSSLNFAISNNTALSASGAVQLFFVE